LQESGESTFRILQILLLRKRNKEWIQGAIDNIPAVNETISVTEVGLIVEGLKNTKQLEMMIFQEKCISMHPTD
jgi:hypothetical protein